MLNIIELEQRWLKYKIKSYLPHTVIVIALFIITLSIVSFFTFKERPKLKEKKKVEQEIQIKPEVIEQTLFNPPKEVVTVITPKKESITLSPSLDFMKKMQNAQQPKYRQSQKAPPVQKREKVSKKMEKVKVAPVEEEVSIIKVQKINIKRRNRDNDIYEIITRFKKNNNPALSLFVAKKYYEMGNYNQAYNYALITNNINSNIESSWIIFAKSLVKLGKKEQAIRTLQEYIMQSHSNNAKLLINEIKSGKFK